MCGRLSSHSKQSRFCRKQPIALGDSARSGMSSTSELRHGHYSRNMDQAEGHTNGPKRKPHARPTARWMQHRSIPAQETREVSSTSMPSLISVARCAASSMCGSPGAAGISPVGLDIACKRVSFCGQALGADQRAELPPCYAGLGDQTEAESTSFSEQSWLKAEHSEYGQASQRLTCCSCVSVMNRRATCQSSRADDAETLIGRLPVPPGVAALPLPLPPLISCAA